MNYKDQQNKLHFIDPKFDHMLPADCVPITDEEAKAIQLAQLTSIPLIIPASLTMKQARLALLDAGYLDNVITGVSQMSREAQISWEFAATVDRNDPLTEALAIMLGLDNAALDMLFTDGAKL
jgi:hypothetical protein